MLMSSSPRWHSPKLLRLPRQYDLIFQNYRSKACTTCNSVPKDPAICLLCGTMLCSKERCCSVSGKHECSRVSISSSSIVSGW